MIKEGSTDADSGRSANNADAQTQWFARPRGRAPRGRDGIEKVWDHTIGWWCERGSDEGPHTETRALHPTPKPKLLKPPPVKRMQDNGEFKTGLPVLLLKQHLPVEIRVHWPEEKDWFTGVVDAVRLEKGSGRRLHHVTYADGDKLWHHLPDETWKFTRARRQKAAKLAHGETASEAGDGAEIGEDDFDEDGELQHAGMVCHMPREDKGSDSEDSIDGFEIHCSSAPL